MWGLGQEAIVGDQGIGDVSEPDAVDPKTGELTPKARPPIKPPGLDLSPAEKNKRVRGHLATARSAMSASTTRPDDAIAAANAALAVDEVNLQAMLYLAHANYVKNYFDKAEYVLGRAARTKGGASNAKLYFLFGLVYDATERPDQAMASYAKAVNINGNYRSALLNLGVHYIRNKRYKDAVKLYEKLTGPLRTNSASAWTNLGSAYRGRTADLVSNEQARRAMVLKAESALKRALTINSKYANAYYNLGILYLDADPFPLGSKELDTLKRLERAKTYFTEYRKMPGAQAKLADEQTAVTQKLYDREHRIREKRRKRELRKKKRKSSGGAYGD
jgi:tetratricopeptide (TPR) repeat protein